MFDLKGKVALITGGSRGIGRAIALRLAKNGADVVVNYVRHRKDAEEIVADIEQLGRSCLAVKANVSKEDDVVRMFETIKEKHEHLDILVSNAASDSSLTIALPRPRLSSQRARAWSPRASSKAAFA